MSHGPESEDNEAAREPVQVNAPLPVVPTADRVLVTIRIDSIYSDALVDVTFVASKPFSVQVGAAIAQITIGHEQSKGQLSAVEKDGIFRVQFQTFDWLRELETLSSTGVPGPSRTYGMRFFPFVASLLRCEMRCSLPVSFTIIDLPDMFRFVWYSFSATSGDAVVTKSVRIRHAYSAERSRFILEWPIEAGSDHRFNWKVRTGGLMLMRAIYLPIYYGLIALIGIAAASFQSKSLTLGGVVATWIFLLRQWIALNPPQRNTILGELYILAGVVLAGWGVGWAFLSWHALWGLAVIIPVVALVRSEADHFSNDARLRFFERWWARRVMKADLYQKKFHKDQAGSKDKVLISDDDRSN